jgi:outer membrane receptor protein involved in Fe transport
VNEIRSSIQLYKSLMCGAAAAALLPLVASQAMAAEPVAPDADQPAELEQIVVFGRGELKIGVAQAASEGTVAGSDLLVRPLLRVAELLEAVPGMVAAQHSGSGKANQYFLRGFNLDHGSDFTTYIDGVQINFRSHGHGHGYLDLNGLIPEIIDRQDYRKGPYRADGGDFALAGASYMSSLDGYERPWAAAEIGAFGWKRAAAGGTAETGDGELTLVGQAKVYDGPWEEAERLRHYAAFAKYAAPTSLGRLELSGHAYRGTWRPTEQIPERIIGSAFCADVFCAPDPTARGETTRLMANAQLTGQGWRGNVYAQHYDWSMSSNPTYANADGSSAQILQFDKRWVFGMTGQRTFAVSPMLDFVVGTENRYDAIGNVGVYHTDRGAFVESLGAYKVGEASAALYGEATWRPVDRLRLTGGLRGDYYRFSVTAKDPEAAALGEGKDDDALVSAKVMAAYKVSDRVELYANWGQGFHSNDVRGVVNRTTPVPTLVRGTGKEVGARFQLQHLTITATYWWLNVGSELRFVGDSNAVEPSGASKRHGYEIVGFWRPRPWLAIDANYTASRARYDNGDYIPNAFDNAAQVGASVVLDRWEASLRMRHLGGYPLIEDNSVRDKGSTVFNTRAAFKPGAIELYAELLNILDSKDKDITYYYESFIPGFDAAPVEGRLSRVVEPRTFRVGMKYNF